MKLDFGNYYMIYTNKNDHFAYLMIAATIVFPVLIGIIMDTYFRQSFINIPFHSAIETFGSVIALICAFFILTIYKKESQFERFYMAGVSFVFVGILDLFHSFIEPSDTFVWLHSLSLFFGGTFFAFSWFKTIARKKIGTFLIPIGSLIVPIVISIFSIIYGDFIPKMEDIDGNFSAIANFLNIFGGFMYVLGSLYFLKSYFTTGENTYLIFAGLSMLFGTSGLLFYFSSIWDLQWWFWHLIKLGSYLLTIFYIQKMIYNLLYEKDLTFETLNQNFKRVSFSNHLLQEYKKALFGATIISVADPKGNIKYANKELLEISGYEEDELIGKPHNIFRDPSMPKAIFKEMWKTIQNKKIFKGLIKNKKKNGDPFYTNITIIPIVKEDREVFEYLALREDVTELVNSQNELKINFYTDNLTKVFNRFKLIEDLKEMKNPHIAILNIDDFKHINNFYGQDFGDQVLLKYSAILLDEVFIYNYDLYRNKGDEFIIVSNKEETFSHFQHNIESIINTVEHKNITTKDESITLQITAGLSCASNEIIKAEFALKEAKQKKEKTFVYSENATIMKMYQNNLLWSNKIKNAIKDDKIDIVFQPIFSNTTNKVDQYETLIRLIDEDGTIIEPSHFLSIAKQTKLYNELTRIVFQKALIFLPQTTQKISIDISASDILDETTRLSILNMFENNPHTNRIILELKEPDAIESFNELKSFITIVKKYGVNIAIDNFGVGYSNFEYLVKLEANYVKLDGTLIERIVIDNDSYNVVETIIAFAHKNNIQVVAESVSSSEILEKVKELGIELSQGFYLGKPNFWSELH